MFASALAACDMYRLVRNFSLASAVAIVIVSAVLGFVLHDRLIGELVSNTEMRNASLARSFANTLGPSLKQFLDRAQNQDPQSLANSSDYQKINFYFRLAAAGLDVLKVKVYLLDGVTVYSSEHAELGEDRSNNDGFEYARIGNVASELTFSAEFNAFDGTVSDRDMVSSFVPILFAGDTIGVLEIYSDVTKTVTKIRTTAIEQVALLVVLFGLLFVVLFLIVRHAEGIIKKQYRDKQR
ncbi:MAG: hypothetical protein JKY27_05800, partial [Magnetovibrio sp.]|nr:hypothetical protein [Magnetovibrio sp.]